MPVVRQKAFLIWEILRSPK